MLPMGVLKSAAGWPEIRRAAEHTEAVGLDSAWVADHFFHRPPEGEPQGLHEAWTLLSAVASATRRIEIAPLVLCSSFRSPGLVANMAATLDLVSDGRLILGVGAGWHDLEYEAFGYPTDHKVGRFAEWLEIVVRLLRGEEVTFDGRWHKVREAIVVPRPERRIPILVAGNKPRMLGLTARYADAWNTAWFGAPDDRLHERLRDLDEALAEAGRDPADLERTVGLIVRDPDQEAEDDEPDSFVLAGGVDELAEALAAHAHLGFGHAIVVLDPMTPRSIERLAEAVELSRGSR
jgi:alkanesulfonate monooxygenase SsuD/methylene tetrahydromethanopterin reductase-like flavin-dependent oxidoreductase (luciferase family)